MTELERLQAENEYLRAENAILKKLREPDWRSEKKRKKKDRNCSERLITEFPLDILLKAVKLALSGPTTEAARKRRTKTRA